MLSFTRCLFAVAKHNLPRSQRHAYIGLGENASSLDLPVGCILVRKSPLFALTQPQELLSRRQSISMSRFSPLDLLCYPIHFGCVGLFILAFSRGWSSSAASTCSLSFGSHGLRLLLPKQKPHMAVLYPRETPCVFSPTV